MNTRSTPRSGLTRRAFLTGAGVVVGAAALGYVFNPSPFSSVIDALGQTEQSRNLDSTEDLDAGIERASTFAFDTLVDLSLYGDRSILDEAIAACAHYDTLFSMQQEGSDVWRINHAQGSFCEVHPDTADLIAKALTFCEISGGVFDITIGSVSSLWDFKEGVKPDDAAIQAALPHVDWRRVEVRGNQVRLEDPGAAIDLGGIAKGWIADALADLFRSRGVTSGIINLGGNVFALGEKPSGSPWIVGIRDPNASGGKSVATIEVRDRSVVTSGLYERHFELDGVDYYHILDPGTGYPALTDVRSDTVVSDLSLEGDGLSTTLFIYGSDRGAAAVEARDGMEAMFMTEDGSVVCTSGFSAYQYTAL